MYNRRYILDLPEGQTAFLWGARKTGKSTYLKTTYQKAIYYDFLRSDVFMELSRSPYLLRHQIQALEPHELREPIILDEVQKIPLLLNEVHWLIENTAAYFILCGSSARKLMYGAANLLGGRAWRYTFYPLTSAEIADFDLLRALNRGLLPSHYVSELSERDLDAYVGTYLKEEIQLEGLTRNLPAFSRFLDALGFSHGQLINYTNIARDCGVSATTVKAYFQILVDTLIGYELQPYRRRVGREIISATPKFYLFDVGVAGYLAKRKLLSLKGAAAGEAFEHFIFMELMAYRGVNHKRFELNYWRTKTGLEVDFILNNGEVAIEVKIDSGVEGGQLKGLIAFSQEHQPEKAIVVSQDSRRRKIKVDDGTDILVMPWQEFLEKLWLGQIL